LIGQHQLATGFQDLINFRQCPLLVHHKIQYAVRVRVDTIIDRFPAKLYEGKWF
jgi:hypothetical protein